MENASSALKLPQNISTKTKDLIIWLMKPNRQMRPQTVTDVQEYLNENTNKNTNKVTAKQDDSTTTAGSSKEIEVVQLVEKPKEQKNSKTKVIAVTSFAAAFLIAGIMYFTSGNNTASETPNTDVKEIKEELPLARTIQVKDYDIKITDGPESKRTYKYTGELLDSVGALPQGKGIANYPAFNSVPASTYEGIFVDGVCEDNTGNAILEFITGDKYKGTFVKGYYGEGTLTYNDGSYFKGTFKNGEPYNGNWYTKGGKPDGKLVNGVEQ